METDLRDLLATIQSPDLRELLDRFLGAETRDWQRFRDAPAAKYYHQAYTHGLLEHSLTVAQAVSAAAALFPGIDREIAVTGALLHDLGKTEAYNADPLAIDLTDVGRLLGEIPIGYYLVRREIESIEGFDPDTAQAILHVILSHHGKLENGSPVVPATREATARPHDGQPRRHARQLRPRSSASCPTGRAGRSSTAGSIRPHTSGPSAA